MESCIFCNIAKGEVPSHKVYEDKEFLVFMDNRPLSPGHVQVIPKKHYRWVWDVPHIGHYFEVVQKIAKAQQKAFHESIRSKVFGEEVAHAHVWLYPNDETPGDKHDYEGNSQKIRAALEETGSDQ
jgi:histidine triad (HIT) family protein